MTPNTPALPSASTLEVVAYLVTSLPRGEPSLCFEDERGDYGDEDHTPVFEALCKVSSGPQTVESCTVALLKQAVQEQPNRDHEMLISIQDFQATNPRIMTPFDYWKGGIEKATADAQAEIQALRADARRLDWLTSQNNCVIQDGGLAGKWLCWMDPYDSARNEHQTGEYPTARAAIDAAVSATGEGGQ